MAKNELTYLVDKRKPGKAKAFFICLGIAAFLWVVHSLNKIYTYQLSVPVSFVNLPGNKQAQFRLPEKLSLDIKVSGLRLALIIGKQPFKTLSIDFNNLKADNRHRIYVLSASRLNFKSVLGFETTVKHISPDTLYFSDKIGFQKLVPVKVPLFVKCEAGYGYLKPTVTPAFVSIWGDSGAVKKIDTLYTTSLNYVGLNKSIDTRVELLRPSNSVYAGFNDVHLKIDVERLVQQSVVLKVSDIHPPVNTRLQLFPSTVKVTFTALQNNYLVSDSVLFKAAIDSEKYNHFTQKCKVIMQSLPPGVTVLNIEPAEVEILHFKRK